jgi:probable rRNA maturation factor
MKNTHKIHIQIDEVFSGDAQPKLIRDTARAALKHQHAAGGALSISVSSDETLQELNRKFLDRDAPTDVLSFPSDSDDPDAEGRYFGDIAISFPRAFAQAAAGGHAVESELQLLTVHGILHLLGHDHGEEKEKAKMWKAQEEILAGLKCEIIEPNPNGQNPNPNETAP